MILDNTLKRQTWCRQDMIQDNTTDRSDLMQTGHDTRQHHWQVRPDADRTWYKTTPPTGQTWCRQDMIQDNTTDRSDLMQTGHDTRQHHRQVRPDADRTWYKTTPLIGQTWCRQDMIQDNTTDRSDLMQTGHDTRQHHWHVRSDIDSASNTGQHHWQVTRDIDSTTKSRLVSDHKCNSNTQSNVCHLNATHIRIWSINMHACQIFDCSNVSSNVYQMSAYCKHNLYLPCHCLAKDVHCFS